MFFCLINAGIYCKQTFEFASTPDCYLSSVTIKCDCVAFMHWLGCFFWGIFREDTNVILSSWSVSVIRLNQINVNFVVMLCVYAYLGWWTTRSSRYKVQMLIGFCLNEEFRSCAQVQADLQVIGLLNMLLRRLKLQFTLTREIQGVG